MKHKPSCECGKLNKRRLVMFLGDDKNPLFDDNITKGQRKNLFLFLERQLNFYDLTTANPLVSEPTKEQRWQQTGNTLASIMNDPDLPESLRLKLTENIVDVISDFSSGADAIEATRRDFVQACQHAVAAERAQTNQ